MNMTTAERIAQLWNADRNAQISANAAFEIVLNASFGESGSLAAVARVSIHHRTIYYTDGSILTVLDQAAAREAGLTGYDYCYKAQDKLC